MNRRIQQIVCGRQDVVALWALEKRKTFSCTPDIEARRVLSHNVGSRKSAYEKSRRNIDSSNRAICARFQQPREIITLVNAQFPTLPRLLNSLGQQPAEKREQMPRPIFRLSLRQRRRNVRKRGVRTIHGIIPKHIALGVLFQNAGQDITIEDLTATPVPHTPTVTFSPRTSDTFKSVSNVTFPLPVSRLESVCTDTPANSASRRCVTDKVSRRLLINSPSSPLFIMMSNTSFIRSCQCEISQIFHYNET